ncbi:MAG: enoyl-CoA hydratase/isomerase family protein, partial [Acidimicrobiia bacterium]
MPGLVHLDSRDDGVTVVRLDNPPVNALSRALLAEIGAVATAVARDDTVKAVVVTGEGKSFAAGADISEFGDASTAREITNGFRGAFDAVAAMPRPVIAAVNGFALGGGMELALACDLRVAADVTRMGQPEILLGVIPGAGGTQRLPRLVGPARAKELVWSGRQVAADEALTLGLVDRVVPAEELVETALAWASELATGAVAAMGLAKAAIDRGLDGPLGAGLD